MAVHVILNGQDKIPAASDITFTDGETFQEKLDNGSLVGPPGEPGKQGTQGPKGDTGDVWVPTVNAAGEISWQKNSTTTPTATNIKGPQGEDGAVFAEITTHVRSVPTDTALSYVNKVGGSSWTGISAFNGKPGDLCIIRNNDTTTGTEGFWVVRAESYSGTAVQGTALTYVVGAAGPNAVSTSTNTNITGLLKGTGSKVAQAVANTDYLTPSSADDKYVPLAGGTMTGGLNGSTFVAGGKPQTTTISNFGVDVSNSTIGTGVSIRTTSIEFNSPTKGTINGLNDPTKDDQAATKKYVDDNSGITETIGDTRYLQKSGGTMSGAIAMGSNKITGLATPTADTDAVNKAYADTFSKIRIVPYREKLTFTKNSSGFYIADTTIVHQEPSIYADESFVMVNVSCMYNNNPLTGSFVVPCSFVVESGVRVPISFDMTYFGSSTYTRIPIVCIFAQGAKDKHLNISVTVTPTVIQEPLSTNTSQRIVTPNVTLNLSGILTIYHYS